MNLLQETIEVLERYKYSPSDVQWVGTHDIWMTWDEFASLAATADYDDSYGSAKVAQDLLVVGTGWWLRRCEYDGSEWWKMCVPILKPDKHYIPSALTVDQANALGRNVSCGWLDLEELQEPRQHET